jgi:hypothetical protein
MDRQSKNDMIKLIFSDLNFDIDIDINDLSKVLSYKDYIFIFCEDLLEKEVILVKNVGQPITIEDAIGALEDNHYFPVSDKTFLKSFKKISEYKFEVVFDY